MSAPGHEAGAESSKEPAPSPGRRPRAGRDRRRDDSGGTAPGVRGAVARVEVLRGVLGLAGLAGCALLVLATFSTLIEIRVLTTTDLAAPIDTAQSGWERHGPALLVLAALGLFMLAGALRGARPAMLALAVTGVASLAIALVWDLPALDDTRGAEELYEGVSAGPEAGYYLETAGGALLVLSGGGLFLIAGRPGREREERRGGAAARERRHEDAGADDWFREDPS